LHIYFIINSLPRPEPRFPRAAMTCHCMLVYRYNGFFTEFVTAFAAAEQCKKFFHRAGCFCNIPAGHKFMDVVFGNNFPVACLLRSLCFQLCFRLPN